LVALRALLAGDCSREESSAAGDCSAALPADDRFLPVARLDDSTELEPLRADCSAVSVAADNSVAPMAAARCAPGGRMAALSPDGCSPEVEFQVVAGWRSEAA